MGSQLGSILTLSNQSSANASEIQKAISDIDEKISRWMQANGSVEQAIKKNARLAKSLRSSVPTVFKSIQARAIGHTHLGPQLVCFGKDYGKIIIGCDDKIDGQDAIMLPLVFKPGLVPDRHNDDAFFISQTTGSQGTSYITFSFRGKWVFYVTSPVHVLRYGVVQWSDVVIVEDAKSVMQQSQGISSSTFSSSGASSSGSGGSSNTSSNYGSVFGEVSYSSSGDIQSTDNSLLPGVITSQKLAQFIVSGVGLWLGPDEIVSIANLYEVRSILVKMANFQDMYRLDFGMKQGDVFF